MPIFAKIAYADGFDLPTMLFFRFALAGGLMAIVMHLRGMHWPRGRNLILLVAMGAIGYSGQAYCYFAALQYATAGLTALLLYLYPVIVTLVSAALSGKGLSRGRLIAVLAALAGTGMAVGGSLDGSPLGIALGVGAALIYSLYILVGERVMQAEGAVAAGTVVMLSSATVYACSLAFIGASWPRTEAGWFAMGGIALLSTLLAIIGFFIAMRYLGAADAATFSTMEPVVTVLLAAAFLGEGVGTWQAVGGVIILASVIVLARSGHRGAATENPPG